MRQSNFTSQINPAKINQNVKPVENKRIYFSKTIPKENTSQGYPVEYKNSSRQLEHHISCSKKFDIDKYKSLNTNVFTQVRKLKVDSVI